MTKTSWATLTGKQQWDTIVTLRGPDCRHSEPIKWLTTSVIRWAMHTIMRVGGTINSDLGMVVVPDNAYEWEGRDNFGFAPAHFFNHVREAAEVLGIPAIGVPLSVYQEAVSLTHPQWTLLKILEWARSDEGKKSHTGKMLEEEITRHLKAHFGMDPDGPKVKMYAQHWTQTPTPIKEE